ncbi:MAG: ATP-binding protein [Myxococcota bacterium]|nr:ATP-binding protein [Myxococcota bacterium]
MLRNSWGDASMEPSLGRVARRRAEWLLLGRLILTAVSLAIAIGFGVPAGASAEAARVGLFWTLALAFSATAISGAMIRSVRHLHRFAAFQIAIDVGIVTALMHFSGGRESPFAFLYVLVTVYGALLFERWGAIGASTLSAACYAGLLLFQNGSLGAGGHVTFDSLAAVWGVHVGALYLVGALASVLSRELRRTGQALDQRTEDLIRLRNLHERTVESIMSGLLTTDRGGRITYFNPEAERITKMTAGEAVGQAVDSVIPGAAELIREPHSCHRKASRARMQFRDRSGVERHLGLAGSILWDEDRSEAGRVLIFQDVTEVVAMERQLRQSERSAAVGEMSAKMAHEIRNPLAAISGSVQVLQAGGADGEVDPEHDQLMQIVVRETDRLSSLIQDFLQYARPRSPRCQPILLGDLVGDVGRLIESVLPETVHLLAESDSEIYAQADPGQLEQILWNLCLNGIQAMPAGGELRVEVHALDAEPPQGPASTRRNGSEGRPREEGGASRWAELVVSDTGVGIPFEVQEHIFEPFFTTKKEGSGLGLSTVHRIVESHGGMLQVESEEGKGTTFRIRLPRPEECP